MSVYSRYACRVFFFCLREVDIYLLMSTRFRGGFIQPTLSVVRTFSHPLVSQARNVELSFDEVIQGSRRDTRRDYCQRYTQPGFVS
jgi:hypothetical protein